MNKLRQVGAHNIIRTYILVFSLGTVMFIKVFGIEWLGLWLTLLVLASVALLLHVHFGDVGSTWNDKE